MGNTLNDHNPDDYIADVETLVSRVQFQDGNLSAVIEGVNSVEDWEFSTDDVCSNVNRLSRTTVRRKLKLLEEGGFLLADRSARVTVWTKHLMFDLPPGHVRRE